MLLDYIIHVAIFSQPFIWWFVYNKNFRIPYILEELINIFFLWSIAMVVILGIRYEFYSTVLIIQYILMVIFCYNVFKRRFDITQAIALSFLVVYMNSYYWESVIHFSEYTQNILNNTLFLNPREIWRLIPCIFFLKKFNYIKDYSVKMLTRGIIISFIISYINFGLFRYSVLINYPNIMEIHAFIREILFMVNRFISLFYLMKVVYHGEKKS
jgi:hypothetical protein